jgi:hypothetical protein
MIVAMTLFVALTSVPAQRLSSAPPPALSVGAAFDAGRERLVVFGGFFRA